MINYIFKPAQLSANTAWLASTANTMCIWGTTFTTYYYYYKVDEELD